MPFTFRLGTPLAIAVALLFASPNRSLYGGDNNGTVTLSSFCWYPGSWHCRLDPEDIVELTLDFDYPNNLVIENVVGLSGYTASGNIPIPPNNPPNPLGTERERILARFPGPAPPPTGSVDLYEVTFLANDILLDQTGGNFQFRLPAFDPPREAALQSTVDGSTEPVLIQNLTGGTAMVGDVVTEFSILSIMDYNGDSVADNADLNALSMAMRNMPPTSMFDINADGVTDLTDHAHWLTLRGVMSADFDLSGNVTASADGAVLLANLTSPQGSLGHQQGDADGDGNVNASGDGAILLAQLAPDASAPVPEPSSVVLIVVGLLALGVSRSR